MAALVAAAGAGPVLMLATGISSLAAVPGNVAVFGDNTWAAGVHQNSATNAYSNFPNGAVDNYYPKTNTHQDASPTSRGVASTNDSGPLGGVAASSGAPSVRYALAEVPNAEGTNAQDDSYNNSASDHAEAHARELTAKAVASYGGQPSDPFRNATAESVSTLEADGSLTVTTHSHVGSADFPGAVHIENVDVVTKITTAAGTATPTATVDGGKVTVKGQGVTIGDQGITVGPQKVPLPGQPPGTDNVRIYAVAPEIHNANGSASVFATGLHVVVTQPGANGVASTSTQYILGEGHAEAFLVAGTPPPAETTPPPPAAPVAEIITTTIQAPSNPAQYTGSTSTPASPRSTPAAPPGRALVAALARPNLALMFLGWEALVLAAAASVVWARRRAMAEQE